MESWAALAFFAATAIAATPQDTQTLPRYVVIAGSFGNFHEALRQAKMVSRAAGIDYSDEGRVFDQKRGWILPDDDEDTAWAGQYVARRYNSNSTAGNAQPLLSVERSDGYTGFAPGYYIAVAGIYNSSREASAAAVTLKRFVPDAYAKRTDIYLGCMH